MNKEQAIQKIDDIINVPKEDYAAGGEGIFSADDCNAIVTIIKNLLNLKISDNAVGIALNDSVLVKKAYTDSWEVKTVSSIRQNVDTTVRQGSANPVSSNAVYVKVQELLDAIAACATSDDLTTAVSEIQNALALCLTRSNITQNTGNSTSLVMSQKAVTEAIAAVEPTDLSNYSTTTEMNAAITSAIEATNGVFYNN